MPLEPARPRATVVPGAWLGPRPNFLYEAETKPAKPKIGRSEYTRGRHWRHGHFSNIVILAEFWHVMFKQLTSNTIFLR